MLRQIVRVYPRNDSRRQELVAELYGVPFQERWFFVAQCLEVAVSEGVPRRYRSWRRKPTSQGATSFPINNVRIGFRRAQVCEIVGITDRQLDSRASSAPNTWLPRA